MDELQKELHKIPNFSRKNAVLWKHCDLVVIKDKSLTGYAPLRDCNAILISDSSNTFYLQKHT